MSKDLEGPMSPKGGGAGGRTKEFVNWVKKAFNKSPSPQRRRFLSLDSINSPPSKPLVFGVSLDELTCSTSHKVPFIVRKIVEHIEENGLMEQGLYRVNGNTRLMNDLRNTFDKMGDADFSSVDIATVGGLLKLWLRELPTPVIPDEFVPEFVEIQETIGGPTSSERLAKLKEAIHKLPVANYELLKYLVRHLIEVTKHSAQNKMASVPLSIVFGPSIFRCGSGLQGLKDQGYTNSAVCRLIQNYEDIFEPDDHSQSSSIASPSGPHIMSPANISASEDASTLHGLQDTLLLPKPTSPEDPNGSTHQRRRFMSLDSGKPLVFGVSLERLTLGSSEKIPFIVRKIVDHIEENGLTEQGLYRVNGSTRLINDLRNTFDKKGDADFTLVDSTTAGGLLKLWLKELPTPVIPDENVPELIQICGKTNAGPTSPERLVKLRDTINKLPLANYELLKYLIRHLVKVTEHAEENKMASVPLSAVFGPSILTSGSHGLKDQSYANSVVCMLIQNYEDIFEPGHTQPSSVTSPVGYRIISPANSSASKGTSFSKGTTGEILTSPSVSLGSHTPSDCIIVTKNRNGVATPTNTMKNEDSVDGAHSPNPAFRDHGGKGSKPLIETKPLDIQTHNSKGMSKAAILSDTGNEKPSSNVRTDGHLSRTSPGTSSHIRVKDMVASLNAGLKQEDSKARTREEVQRTGDKVGSSEDMVDAADIDEPLVGKDGKLLVSPNVGQLSSTYPVSHMMSSTNTDRLSATSKQPSPSTSKKERTGHQSVRDTQLHEVADGSHIHHGKKRKGSSENSPTQRTKVEKVTSSVDPERLPVLLGDEAGVEEEGSPFQRQYAKRKLTYTPSKSAEVSEHIEADSKSPSTRGESPWQNQASLKRVSTVIQTCLEVHLCRPPASNCYRGANVYGLLIPSADEMENSQKRVPVVHSPVRTQSQDEDRSTKEEEKDKVKEHQSTTESALSISGVHSHKTLKGSSYSQPELSNSCKNESCAGGSSPVDSPPDHTFAKSQGSLPEQSPAKRKRPKAAASGSSRPQSEKVSTNSLILSATLPETLPGALPEIDSLRASIASMLLLLEEKRKKERRPYKIWDMTPQQLQAEKRSLQRTLLHFEKKHGKPASKDEKELVRPLYERYRDVKRLFLQHEKLSSTCAF